MMPYDLYAALDEPSANVDFVLGQIADWLLDHGEMGHHEWVRTREAYGACETCGHMRATKMQCPWTQYPDDDANRVGQLCYSCHAEYEEYWGDMWAEYYSMVR